MNLPEAAGYLASGLVLTAFCMKDIASLRIVAIAGNVAFMTYGIGLDLVPVWSLHAVLLPINGWRLWQTVSSRHSLSIGSTRAFRATRTGDPLKRFDVRADRAHRCPDWLGHIARDCGIRPGSLDRQSARTPEEFQTGRGGPRRDSK